MTNSYSSAHEREECRKMTRGLWHSVFGILLSPIPGLGLLFAISGFIRQIVRITRKYRIRNAIFTVIALIALLASIGILAYEAFVYSRNPKIVSELGHSAWYTVTGQEEFPWVVASQEGTDYGDSDTPGLGIFDEDEYMDDEQGDEVEYEAEIDLESLPDVASIMEDIRHPFAQYEP